MKLSQIKQSRVLLTEQVHQVLKKGILTGVFSPGERLYETELSKKLGVSRTPIREALGILKSEGFITQLVGGGIKVTEHSIKEVNEIFDLRELLECYGVEKAIDNISETQIKRLAEILDMCKMAQKYTNIETIMELNKEFHELILRASNNEKLFETANSIKCLSDYWRISMFHPSEPAVSIQGHQEVFNAIKNKDKLQAVAAMKNHLRMGRMLMLEKIDENKKFIDVT
ncbi:MAG: GntR family transcriptional regulator [Peptococcaceae bacterium]